jgi:hypothetical protein
VKRGGNPPDLPPLIKPAAPHAPHITPHHTTPPQSRLCFSCTAQTTLVVQLPRTLRLVLRHALMPPIDSLRPKSQPTTTYACCLFDELILHSARRSFSHIARGFYSNCSTILSRLAAPTRIQARKFWIFGHFLKANGHFGSLCAYPLPPLSHHPISTLLLRSYRRLNHSTGPLIIHILFPYLHFIIPAHYLTHSPGAMHSALTLIAQLSSI